MLSKNEYISNGKTVRFQITFPFVNRDTVSVSVGGLPAEFKFLNDGMIELANTPTNREIVQIKRTTDISNIFYNYTKNEVLDADEINSNKLQLIFALQESVETELDSLKKDEDGTMYLKLDMNGHQIINLADATDNLDAVNYGQLIKMIEDAGNIVPESGFEIGHSIVSARSDQDSELVGGVQKWIPRDIPQQLIKTDYPELATIYPETPGGIVDIINDIRYPNYITVNNNVYPDFATGDVYYSGSGSGSPNRTAYKIDTLGNETLLKVFPNPSNGTTKMAAYNDTVVAVTSYFNQLPTFEYSLNGGTTWNLVSIPGMNANGTANIIHLNGKFVVYQYQYAPFNIAHSSDGINWTVVDPFTIGIDINKMQSQGNIIPQIGVGRWFVDNGDFIITANISAPGQKMVMYRVDSDFTSATELLYTASTALGYTSGSATIPTLDGKIVAKEVSSQTNTIVQFSNDFGATITRTFDLSTLVPNITSFRQMSRIGEDWLATFTTLTESYIVLSSDDWLTASVIYSTSDSVDHVNNYLYSSNTTDDIPDNKLYQNFYRDHFIDYDVIVGSNLTFDMPTMDAPSEGVGGIISYDMVSLPALPFSGCLLDFTVLNNYVYQSDNSDNIYRLDITDPSPSWVYYRTMPGDVKSIASNGIDTLVFKGYNTQVYTIVNDGATITYNGPTGLDGWVKYSGSHFYIIPRGVSNSKYGWSSDGLSWFNTDANLYNEIGYSPSSLNTSSNDGLNVFGLDLSPNKTYEYDFSNGTQSEIFDFSGLSGIQRFCVLKNISFETFNSSSGLVRFSYDGTSVIESIDPSGGSQNRVCYQNGSDIYVLRNNGHIIKSIDNGITWELMTSSPSSIIRTDQRDLFLRSQSTEYFLTSDGNSSVVIGIPEFGQSTQHKYYTKGK